jgi:hypothetical protein
VRVYGAAFQRLQAHIEALTNRWLAESEKGDLSKDQLRALASYKRLLAQIAQEINRFGEYAGTEMDQGTREAVAQAIRDAQREVQLSLPAIPQSALGRAWRNLPNEAVETLLGMTETGSPLRQKMDKELGSAVAQLVADRLLQNAALGRNPRETARTVQRELGVGLEWALRTVRTAQIWSYRTAKQQSWAENPDLYKGWAWHAHLGDPRTCPACIAMHGTMHPPDEKLNDHYNGRCSPIVKTPTYAEIMGLDVEIPGDVSPADRVESGAEWFAKQSDAFQLQVLGGARYRAYKAGKLTMDESDTGIVGQRKDEVYGPMRHARSLKAVLGDDAKGYYAPRGPKRKPPEPTPTAREPLQPKLPLETEVEGPFWERPGARPMSATEQGLISEIAEAKGFDDPGLKSYVDSLEQNLKEEAAINQALYNAYGIGPQEATLEDWRGVADSLDKRAVELYEKYTKSGIRSYVAHKRGAKDSGYMVVGKEQILVKQGHFSRAAATRMEGQIWREAKDELSEAYGMFLKRAGFRESEIAKANYEQRQRLLSELAEKDVSRYQNGQPRQIDKVSARARARVVEEIDFDIAASARAAAQDPLATPGLDAYDMMETADYIRTIRLGEGA